MGINSLRENFATECQGLKIQRIQKAGLKKSGQPPRTIYAYNQMEYIREDVGKWELCFVCDSCYGY